MAYKTKQPSEEVLQKIKAYQDGYLNQKKNIEL